MIKCVQSYRLISVRERESERARAAVTNTVDQKYVDASVIVWARLHGSN